MLCKKTNSLALSIAIVNDFDKVAIQLLEHGAKIFFSESVETKTSSPIFAAIVKRKLEILVLMDED